MKLIKMGDRYVRSFRANKIELTSNVKQARRFDITVFIDHLDMIKIKEAWPGNQIEVMIAPGRL